MQFDLRQSLRMAIATVLVALFIVPTDALAQSHVVSPADLQKASSGSVAGETAQPGNGTASFVDAKRRKRP